MSIQSTFWHGPNADSLYNHLVKDHGIDPIFLKELSHQTLARFHDQVHTEDSYYAKKDKDDHHEGNVADGSATNH